MNASADTEKRPVRDWQGAHNAQSHTNRNQMINMVLCVRCIIATANEKPAGRRVWAVFAKSAAQPEM